MQIDKKICYVDVYNIHIYPHTMNNHRAGAKAEERNMMGGYTVNMLFSIFDVVFRFFCRMVKSIFCGHPLNVVDISTIALNSILSVSNLMQKANFLLSPIL